MKRSKIYSSACIGSAMLLSSLVPAFAQEASDVAPTASTCINSGDTSAYETCLKKNLEMLRTSRREVKATLRTERKESRRDLKKDNSVEREALKTGVQDKRAEMKATHMKALEACKALKPAVSTEGTVAVEDMKVMKDCVKKAHEADKMTRESLRTEAKTERKAMKEENTAERNAMKEEYMAKRKEMKPKLEESRQESRTVRKELRQTRMPKAEPQAPVVAEEETAQ